MRPSGVGCRPTSAAAARGRRVTLEQGVLGLGVERRRGLVEHEQERALAHESPRQRQLLPLPEAELHAAGPGGAELCLEPRDELLDDVAGAGAIDRGRHRRQVVHPRQVADTHGVARLELEPKEVLKRTRRRAIATAPAASAPALRRRPESARSSADTAGTRASPASTCRRRSRPRSRPPSRASRCRLTSIEHQAVGAGIGERHVLEADAVAPACSGTGASVSCTSDAA